MTLPTTLTAGKPRPPKAPAYSDREAYEAWQDVMDAWWAENATHERHERTFECPHCEDDKVRFHRHDERGVAYFERCSCVYGAVEGRWGFPPFAAPTEASHWWMRDHLDGFKRGDGLCIYGEGRETWSKAFDAASVLAEQFGRPHYLALGQGPRNFAELASGQWRERMVRADILVIDDIGRPGILRDQVTAGCELLEHAAHRGKCVIAVGLPLRKQTDGADEGMLRMLRGLALTINHKPINLMQKETPE